MDMDFLQWEERELKWKRERLLLFVEGVLGVASLIFLCFNNNVWWDEAYTYDMVTHYSWSGIIFRTAQDVHPPFYYFLARLAVILFGSKLIVLKMVSVSANVAAIALGITKVYKRFGFKAAGMFVFLSCFAPQMAMYSVMLRMYGWASFFILASAVYGYEALCDNQKRDWILLVLFSLLGAYTLYFACISISFIYLFMLLLILAGRRGLLKRFLYAVLATMVGYAPWLYVFFRMTLGGLGKIPEDVSEETFARLLKVFWTWSFDCGVKSDTWIYAGLLFLALFAVWLWKRADKIEALFVTAMCMVPFYTIFLGMFMNHLAGRMLLNRYIEPTLLLVWLGFSIGLSKYKNRLFYAASACLLLLGIESFRAAYYDEYHIAPLLGKTESFIEDEMEPGDAVVYELEPYEIMYAYYMPTQELIYYKNLDIAQYQGKSFWYIDAWGGYFDAETVEKYQLQKEECGNFGIQSMNFKIYRITVNGNE